MTLALIPLLFLMCTDTLVTNVTKGLWPLIAAFNFDALFHVLLVTMAIVAKGATFSLSRG